MARIFAVGDSIARGIAGARGLSKNYSHGDYTVQQMRPFFQAAIRDANAGDTVIVSAGYNGGISDTDKNDLTGWIRQLRANDVNVVILGLREQWTPAESRAAAAARDHGRGMEAATPGINRQLDSIADASDAVFAESTIEVANSIPGGRIHGNYPGLYNKALTELRSRGASVSTSEPEAPARTGRGTRTRTRGAARARTTGDDSESEETAREETTDGRRTQREGDRAQDQQNGNGGFMDMLMNIPIIGPIIRMIYEFITQTVPGLFNGNGGGSQTPGGTPAPGGETPAPQPGQQPASTPDQARAQADQAVGGQSRMPNANAPQQPVAPAPVPAPAPPPPSPAERPTPAIR